MGVGHAHLCYSPALVGCASSLYTVCIYFRFILPIVFPITIGIISGVTSQALGIPLPWLVGPAIGCMALSVVSSSNYSFPGPLYQLAVALVAVTVGLSFDLDALAAARTNFLAICLTMVATIALSMMIARLLDTGTTVGRLTALLSATPAGASGMVAMAGEVGADQRYVAAVQYLRLLAVILVVPLVASQLGDTVYPDAQSTISGTSDGVQLDLSSISGMSAHALALSLAAVGWTVGKYLRVPAGVFVGPLALVTILRVGGLPDLNISETIVRSALLSIGIAIGIQFNLGAIKDLGRNLAWGAVATLILITSCGLLGYALYAASDLDLLTSLLATTPGGMEVVMITAIDQGADTTMVAAVQLSRLIILLALTPVLVYVLRTRALY
jgi:uncharacterized protein